MATPPPKKGQGADHEAAARQHFAKLTPEQKRRFWRAYHQGFSMPHPTKAERF